MLLTYKNHKPLRYKSQVKQQVSEASGSILVVDVVEPDLHDLDLRMLHRRHGKLPVLRARAMPIRPSSVTIKTSFFIVCPFCRFSSVLYYKCAAKHFLYTGRVRVMAAFSGIHAAHLIHSWFTAGFDNIHPTSPNCLAVSHRQSSKST